MNSGVIVPTVEQQQLLDGLQVRLLEPDELPRAQQLLDVHHYLGGLQPVGERLYYALIDAHRDWLGVLVFCAAPAVCARATSGSAGPTSNAAAASRSSLATPASCFGPTRPSPIWPPNLSA